MTYRATLADGHGHAVKSPQLSLTRHCVVMIPAHVGSGHHFYEVTAESSFAAAWKALQEHEAHQPKLPDESVLRVIVDGTTPVVWNANEHNDACKNYRDRVGRVREWASETYKSGRD